MKKKTYNRYYSSYIYDAEDDISEKDLNLFWNSLGQKVMNPWLWERPAYEQPGKVIEIPKNWIAI